MAHSSWDTLYIRVAIRGKSKAAGILTVSSPVHETLAAEGSRRPLRTSHFSVFPFIPFQLCIGRLEPDGTRRRTGGEVKEKDANGVGSQQPCTVRRNMVYPWSIR